jgi:superfamily II DNA or RNA helicase
VTPLKQFQKNAVESAVDLFIETATLIDQSSTLASRKVVIQHNGALLIEAPTGAGKTLIAGNIAERVSNAKKTVWLWFAPFSGLVEQAESTISNEFRSLRTRDLITDRNAPSTQTGDVFVTTWAAVVTNRRSRNDGEAMPSVDNLLMALKAEHFKIGVVVDEAHHGFNKARQALDFYKSIIDPDFTILITATPKDKDVDVFKKEAGISELHRISISRKDCVDAGLIKKGVRAIAFKADESQENLIDFEMTALRHGTEAHRGVIKLLRSIGSDMTPLMLVQVDSAPGSIETAKSKLMQLGFRDSEIAIHTADEPDPDLIGLAKDEQKQVLIFKMAVALGFDAPRAFTLVSMRRSRDESFGVQIVGRILRVDRRLQSLELPDSLNYGYVFLADYASQTGLSLAADRTNAIQTQLTSVSRNVALVTVGDQGAIVQHLQNGQASLLGEDPNFFSVSPTLSENQANRSVVSAHGNKPPHSPLLGLIMPDIVPDTQRSNSSQSKTISAITTEYTYPLREDIQFPRSFKREQYPLNLGAITQDIVSTVRITPEILAASRRRSARVVKKEMELFEHGRETVSDTLAELSDKAIAAKAQQSLFASESEYINSRQIYGLMLERLKKEFIAQGWSDMLEDSSLKRGLDLILAAYPNLLKNAIRECLANHAIAVDAAAIPDKITSEYPLQSSRLNIYRVISDSLNRWEKEFADKLDNDTTGTVLWWHRNEDRKPWSVSIVIPGFNDFYPDFIVGVKDRIKGSGILLIEVKGEINNARGDSVAKARAEHKIYRKSMMVYWEDEKRWYTVRYDESSDKNKLDRLFDFDLMAGF